MYNLNTGLWYYIVNVENQGIPPAQYILLTVSFVLLSIAAGYLLGSINSAIIVSKLLYKEDIRTHGSGNAGLTNMLRTYGKRAALFTLIGDMLKTTVAIFIGGMLGGFGYFRLISVGGSTCDFPLAYIAGFFAIIGHVYPVFYDFKGGKGVLCAATMALILTPIEALILILLFVLVVWISKYVSLGSVSAAVLYPVAVHGHLATQGQPENGIMALITVLIAIFIVYWHRGNLKRISEGTERKLSIGSSKKKEKDDE